MSDEHDSWMKSALGVDIGGALEKIKDEAVATFEKVEDKVVQVVKGAEAVVEGAIGEVTQAVGGVVQKVANAVSPPAPQAGASSGGGTGSFPLGGSVGRGGKNASGDVRAVQTALGLGADGQCGPQTIASIEAFQRSIGQAKPDGRVDAGGGTEKALASGRSAPPPAPATSEPPGLIDQAVQGAKSVAGKLFQGDDDSSGSSDGPKSDLVAGLDKGQFAADIVGKLKVKTDLISQLNNLDDFRTTDPDPVPEDNTSFAGVNQVTLLNQIKDKQFQIAQLETTRTNICKKTRADARLAEKNLVASMTQALSGTGTLSLGTIVASMSGAISAGGSLGLLMAMTVAIAAEHELYRAYRDNLKLSLEKAKLDLTVINTNIAVENKRLLSMKKAASQPLGDEVVIKPFVRPAAPPEGSDDVIELD